MLLQTNSYIVPKDRRAEHARLLRRFRQTLARLGCDHFEVYEQVGQNWSSEQTSGRFVQIMRFRDRPHQLAVQSAERTDPTAQRLIAEFCDIINFPYQQQHGLFAVGFYTGALPAGPARPAGRAREGADGAEQPPAVPSAQTTAFPPPSSEQTDVAAPAAPEQLAEVAHTAAPDTHEAVDEMAAIPMEASEPPEHEAGTNGDSAVLAAEVEPQDRCAASIVHDPAEELGSRSEDQFGPHADASPGAYGNGDRVAERDNGETKYVAGGSGIGEVLNRGGMEIDDLDVPLPAELIDEPDEFDVPVPQHGMSGHIADESDHSR